MSGIIDPVPEEDKPALLEGARLRSILKGASPEFAQAQVDGAMHGVCATCGTKMQMRLIVYFIQVYCPKCWVDEPYSEAP